MIRIKKDSRQYFIKRLIEVEMEITAIDTRTSKQNFVPPALIKQRNSLVKDQSMYSRLVYGHLKAS